MLRGIATYARRHHLALLALFLALGGTSFAAGNRLLPRNSVGTAQLRNGAVTKKKIAKTTLVALKGNRGQQGIQGATGPQGAQGPQGPGATSFSTTEPQDSVYHTLTTVAGLSVRVGCLGGGVTLVLGTSGGTATVDVSGTVNNGGATSPFDTAFPTDAVSIGTTAMGQGDMDVIGRNTAVSNAFSRFDLHVRHGAPCTAWGMITPSKVG